MPGKVVCALKIDNKTKIERNFRDNRIKNKNSNEKCA